MLLLLLREVVVTRDPEKAEATPVKEDRPVAAFREVFRNAATEQRKIIAVLPKIMFMFKKFSKFTRYNSVESEEWNGMEYNPIGNYY